ncbi:MAG: response regulator [Candidatus Binatia bacterium]
MKKLFTPAKKKTILIVDDDQFVTQIYPEKLEAQGFKVELTRDFDSTLQTLKKAAVDLVILDLCLPGINVVELIKNIRSDSTTQSIPIIAFSNPYLSNLTRAAVEAGATKYAAKVDNTPEQIIELVRELGLGATSRVGVRSAIEELEANQEKLTSKLLINRPEILAKLRASYQSFTRTEREDLRRAALLQMHRQLRLLATGASALAFKKIARMSTALEGLLVELYTEPVKITPSVVRTVAHSIETLASLVDRATNSKHEVIASPNILVVDDEIISRETICSALGRGGFHAKSLNDPLAAQSLLEREHFDLIFLDVEMPGQTGLELCVKIRGIEPNRTTPIVFVTSHSDFGSRAQSTLSGGNDFIAKPFLLVELAVKALTWLFKEGSRPLLTASVQNGVPAEARSYKSEVAANHGVLEPHDTSPVT